MPASPILTVKIVGPLGECECYVEFEDAKENPSLFLQHVMRHVEELKVYGTHARATYLDDEGYACTFIEQTVTDALFMARCQDGDEASKVLEIHVQETSPGAARAAENEAANLDTAAALSVEDRTWIPASPGDRAGSADGGAAATLCTSSEAAGATASTEESPSSEWSDVPALQPGGPLAQLRATVSQVTDAFRFCADLPTIEMQHAFLGTCRRGDFVRAKRLARANPLLINGQPAGRWSALHHFARRGHRDAVQFLLDHGADAAARNSDGKTPMEVADPSVIELFIPTEDSQGDPIRLGPGLAGEPDCEPAASPSERDAAAAPELPHAPTTKVAHTFRRQGRHSLAPGLVAAAGVAEQMPGRATRQDFSDADTPPPPPPPLELFLEQEADEARRRAAEEDAMKHAEEAAKLTQSCRSLKLENTQLAQTCSSLQAENSRLTEACGSLRSENSTLAEECHSLHADNQRLQGLSERAERAEEISAEAARAKHRLEHELEEARAHSNDLLAQMTKLQATLQEALRLSEERGLQVDCLHRELAAGHALVDCLESELAAARAAAEAPADAPIAVQAQAGPQEDASAKVLDCEQLVVGVEVREDESARGDITEELKETVAAKGARSAYRVASVCLDAEASGEAAGNIAASVPVCAQVHVENDGTIEWPTTTAVVLLSGLDLGLPLLPLGAVASGEVAEIILDLQLPSRSVPEESRTTWAVADAATGQPLGPLLVFDVTWKVA